MNYCFYIYFIYKNIADINMNLVVCWLQK